jgi:hypothetical protein
MPKTKSLYGVHPGVMATQKWVATLKEKSGRSLDEWLTLVKKSGSTTEKERRECLTKEHNLGTNSAWWIAERAEGVRRFQGLPQPRLRADQTHHANAHRPRIRIRPSQAGRPPDRHWWLGEEGSHQPPHPVLIAPRNRQRGKALAPSRLRRRCTKIVNTRPATTRHDSPTSRDRRERFRGC